MIPSTFLSWLLLLNADSGELLHKAEGLRSRVGMYCIGLACARAPALVAHFSDYYPIMDDNDKQIYSHRLQEIIDWGLRNMRVPEKKGFFESVAEDWPFVPTGLRQWLRNVNGDFVAAHQKRQERTEAHLNKTREVVMRGLQHHGFLVQYYMYNHDGDAMGGSRHLRLPRVQPLLKPSVGQVVKYCTKLRTRKFNHPYVGVTQEFQPYGEKAVEEWLLHRGYEGFKVRMSRVHLGKGLDVYEKAKQKMVRWELNDAVDWVSFIEGEHGINLASRIRAYGLLWTINPLRKVLCHEKPFGDGGAVAAVAVSTLRGHLLQGEERFSIAYEGKGGDVYFDMLSFSKGAPPLGAILMPFIRPLQAQFFKDLGKAMQKAVGGATGLPAPADAAAPTDKTAAAAQVAKTKKR